MPYRESMSLGQALDIALRKEPVDYVFGGRRTHYNRIMEVGIMIDDEGVQHPFVTLNDKNGNSTLRTKLRYVERVQKSPLLTRESAQTIKDENETAGTGERAGDQCEEEKHGDQE